MVPSVVPTPVYQQAVDADGFGWYYSVRPTETGGGANKINSFSIDGIDVSEYISAWFGTTSLPAKGTLSASMRSKDVKVPIDRVFAFGGVDNQGQSWTQQITVPFRGAKGTAAMTLTSTPETILALGKPDPNCSAEFPLYQQLNLQERNGYDVRLTKFIAAENDFSSQIAKWFGSAMLPASGTLHASMCWQMDSFPYTANYEVEGVDASGAAVKATLQVKFVSLDSKSGGPNVSRAIPASRR